MVTKLVALSLDIVEGLQKVKDRDHLKTMKLVLRDHLILYDRTQTKKSMILEFSIQKPKHLKIKRNLIFCMVKSLKNNLLSCFHKENTK
jgi:hypothetical protein